MLVRALLRRARDRARRLSFVIAFAGVFTAGASSGVSGRTSATTAPMTTIAGMVRGRRLRDLPRHRRARRRPCWRCCSSVGYLRTGRARSSPSTSRLMLLLGRGHVAMTTANDLVVVFLALEVLSIPLYVLAAFDRRRLSSQEAGHQVLPARRVLVRDLPLRRRAHVRRHGHDVADRHRHVPGARTHCSSRARCSPGFALLLVGLGFKVAAVPFHMWTPDVYQGAPTPVTAFMSSATKAAGFAALIRVFTLAFPLYREDWRPAVWVLAVLTLAVGSIAAVVQTDVKRVLAYSSIAHAGYILIGFQVATTRGREAALALPLHLRVHDDRRVRRDHRGQPARRRPPLVRRLPRAWRCGARCSAACSPSSCSRRPESR